MWCPEEQDGVSTSVDGMEEGDLCSFTTSRVGQCLVVNTSESAGESSESPFAILTLLRTMPPSE